MTIKYFIQKYKYELLLFALIQHLFIGILLNDMESYRDIIWPINMLVLGIASTGVFIEKGKWKNRIRTILFICVVALPIGIPFFGKIPNYFAILNIIYVGLYLFIFYEIIKFLLKPSYINADIISASACGYFLLIEISVFLFQFFLTQDINSFKGLNLQSNAETYMDLVYFSSITLTSIGFGDITPNSHYTKLLTSLFGIAGQFYTVVLVGILLSKFSSNSEIK